MENINAFKVSIVGIFAGISAALGWFGCGLGNRSVGCI